MVARLEVEEGAVAPRRARLKLTDVDVVVVAWQKRRPASVRLAAEHLADMGLPTLDRVERERDPDGLAVLDLAAQHRAFGGDERAVPVG